MKWLLLGVMIAMTCVVTEAYAQRGCCSWHGGVSGCTISGRVICNDGTLSPSCTCG